MEGSRVFETNEMTIAEHRVCVVDINLEQYFQEEFSRWDKIERVVLCPSKRNHRNKFDETGDETLDSITLESTIQTIIISAVAKKKLEQLEQDITFVLKKVREKIEVQKKNSSFKEN